MREIYLGIQNAFIRFFENEITRTTSNKAFSCRNYTITSTTYENDNK